MSFWDDEDLQDAINKGKYHSLKEIGAVVEGVVASLEKRTFDPGTDRERVAIEVQFDDGSKLTAGQILLMQALTALRPEKAETLRVELIDVERRGNRTLKRFHVQITGADGSVREENQAQDSATESEPAF